MTSYQLFLLFLTIYITVLVGTGLYFSKRQKTLADFWLAGRDAGVLSIGFSAAASWLTAGALLAVIGFFLLLGMGSIWGFVAPNILALLIIGLLVKKIRKLPAITQPELLERRYGSYLRLPVALIITVVMILFAVSDIKGFAMVLQVFYGVDPIHAALIVGLAVAVYVTLGGLSAVITTDIIQFLCLAFFVLVMAVMVMAGASDVSALTVSELFTSMPESWWNPVSIGLPMVLIFVFAIVPGWISEQDPWQRVWAAKDDKAARNGMFLGSVLVALVFGCCAVIAVGLNTLFPEIARMGFPMGMAKAEPALLNFIMGSGLSDVAVALCGVALATAAMSCADTFATSGASCLARDVYQRHLHPGATMKEMRLVNRISVIAIVVLATLGSFFINSIIDAIHIATFIASASYFFVLMGGLYWKRATGSGAVASLCTGFLIQVALVIFDLVKTAPMAPPYLESLHPLLMGHGVIVAMAISGSVFIGVSLATKKTEKARLAPFFPTEEIAFASSMEKDKHEVIRAGHGGIGTIDVGYFGEKVRLHLAADLLNGVEWNELVEGLVGHSNNWHVMTGGETIQRFGRGRQHLLSTVMLTRGENRATLWFETEGDENLLEQLEVDLSKAYMDVESVLDLGRVQQTETAEDFIRLKAA
ncbi:MAG: SSS family solute:Na+ symporter [Desulforhopalus sp.]|jgi:SSS family solute:Na+ symporter